MTGPLHTHPGQGIGSEPASELPMLEPVLTYRILLPFDSDVHKCLQQFKQLEEEEPEPAPKKKNKKKAQPAPKKAKKKKVVEKMISMTTMMTNLTMMTIMMTIVMIASVMMTKMIMQMMTSKKRNLMKSEKHRFVQ